MRPIYNYLKNRKKTVDFKFPGHKKRIDYDWIREIDETETLGTDNLYDAQGIIRESLSYAKALYGTKETLYMVNGSTGAIQAAILSQASPGDKVLIQRNSHMSVYQSLVLARLRPSYLYPDLGQGFLGAVSYEEVQRALDKEDYKFMVLTSPSYEGFIPDLKRIIDLAHSKGVLVIVDEAHGSHLAFSPRLPASALEVGADLVIHSAHKTLPSLTQTALAHINSDRVDGKRFKDFIRMTQTSSPSYVFMASLENALDYMDGPGRQKLDQVIDYCYDFEKKVSENLLNTSIVDSGAAHQDPLRLVISHKAYQGSQLYRILYEDYDINLEMESLAYVVAVASPMSEKEDFDRLYEALEDLDSREGQRKDFDFKLIKEDKVIDPYEAFYSPREERPIGEALGRLSADYIIPYPPGQVLLGPGERVRKDHIDLLRAYEAAGIRVLKGPGLGLVKED